MGLLNNFGPDNAMMLGASILANNGTQPYQTVGGILGNAFSQYAQTMAQQQLLQQQQQLHNLRLQQEQREQAEYDYTVNKREKMDAALADYQTNPTKEKLTAFVNTFYPQIAFKTQAEKEAAMAAMNTQMMMAGVTAGMGMMGDYYTGLADAHYDQTGVYPPPSSLGLMNFGGASAPSPVAPQATQINAVPQNAPSTGPMGIPNINTAQASPNGLGFRHSQDVQAHIAKKQGEADIENQKQVEAKGKISRTLGSMHDIYQTLDQNNAIRNPDRTAGENVINYFKTSVPGQEMQRMVGGESQSLRDQIKVMQPKILLDIKEAADMGVKMMDTPAEIEFYLRMATDPDLDIKANMMALNVVEAAFGQDKTVYEAVKRKADSMIKPGTSDEIPSDIQEIIKERNNGG